MNIDVLFLFNKSYCKGLTLETWALLSCRGEYYFDPYQHSKRCLTSPPARQLVEDSLENKTFVRSMEYSGK